jgi:hypothetical protein
MPLIATRGAASAQGFGEFAQSAVVNYIEEVFSTYLYTGNSSTQTITNNIDLSTKGGLVWAKSRAAGNHFLYDTARGVNKYLMSNATDSQTTQANSLTAFNTTGFSIGDALFNDSAVNYASWTFREQAKFFDVVTYTGNGTTQNISHNLGSAPGCIIVKNVTSGTANWTVYHQSLGADYQLRLNLTNASNYSAGATWGNNTVSVTPTSTQFTVGSNFTVNESGSTHVAYLFAHNAGGFGLTGSDHVISCGSFTVDGSGNATVSLGYEPQWVMVKASSDTSNWEMYDSMRGLTATSASARLYPNLSSAEGSASSTVNATSTGFTVGGNMGAGLGGVTYIYIAIRRGPMKVPTLGTTVFASTGHNGTGATNNSVTFDPVPYIDLTWIKSRNTASTLWAWTDRLRGATKELDSSTTTAETTYANDVTGFDFMSASGQSIRLGSGASGNVNTSSYTYSDIGFRRAPGFFDEVCGTGTGANVNMTHNLGVIPELLIVRPRSAIGSWQVGFWGGGGSNAARTLVLNQNDGSFQSSTWSGTANATTFATRGTAWIELFDQVGVTYVAYLFATVAGVSKVGSYTGTATTKQVDCGFTTSARFVLIKRTDSTGDWYVWDSARGIIAGNDPYLLLNSTNAEVTGTDYIDPLSTGFEISSTAPAAINANGGTYIFLAIA